jgi:hypothetical protein
MLGTFFLGGRVESQRRLGGKRAERLMFLAPLFVWYFVLNNVAVYRSISLAPGTVTTQDFHLNYSGYYRIGNTGRKKTPSRASRGLTKVE